MWSTSPRHRSGALVSACYGPVVGAPAFQAVACSTSSLQVNQLLVGIHSIAACEALLLADKLGVHNHEALLSCLSTSLGNSNVLQRHGPVIAKR